MPKRIITSAEMYTVFERVAGFIPGLEYTMMNLLSTQGNEKITRNQFAKALYTMKNAISEQISQHKTNTEALQKARNLWKEKGASSYSFIQQMSCFCMTDYTRPITYQVKDGKAQTGILMYADDNTTVGSGIIMDFYTVESAFDMIESAIKEHVASLNVTYDETTGYPKSISIDYNQMIADEEKYYTFTINK